MIDISDPDGRPVPAIPGLRRRPRPRRARAGLRPASTPPSTGSVVPVIQPASPPARKRIASTTSPGWPRRPSGWKPLTASSTSCASLGRHEALVGGRLDERERDRVDADALGRELEREVLGQRVAAGLGGRVGARRRRGDRVDRPHRADVDDRAAAALAHRRRRPPGRPSRSGAGSSRAPPRSAPRSARGTGRCGRCRCELTSTSTPPKRSTAAATSACACSRVGDLAGVDRDALAASGRARRARPRAGLAGAAEDDARALVEEAPRGGRPMPPPPPVIRTTLFSYCAWELPPGEDRCMCIEYTCICI